MIGPRFPATWVWASDPAAVPLKQVLQRLERLADLEFLRRLPPAPEPEYEFKHAVTREAVYGSLTASRRETLHERVAEFIEQTYPDELRRFVDVLAHHYGQTGNLEKRRAWLRDAAEGARAAFATETAIGYYEELLDPFVLAPGQRGELLIELGDLLRRVARWSEAADVYQEALSAAERTSDRVVHAQASRGLGSVLPYTAGHEQAVSAALDKLGRAAIEFEQLGDLHGLTTTLERLSWTFWELGRYEEALDASEQQLAIADELDDSVAVSTALESMGIVRWRMGDYPEATTLLQRALEVASNAGYRPGIILAANDLAAVRSDSGDLVPAMRYFLLALAVAEEIGDRRMAAIVIGNIGEIHRRQGEYARALQCFGHGFRIAFEIGDRTSMSAHAGNLAIAIAAQGGSAEAQRLLDRAIELARALHAQYWLCEWLYQQGLLLAAAGRLQKAEWSNQEVLELAAEHDQTIELRARLLSIRLRVDLRRITRGAAIRELRSLRDRWTEAPDQAMVLRAIWQLDPTQEQIRRDAARRYWALYEQNPVVEYREAYEELSGDTLPRPRPLPPLPDSVGREPIDLSQMLRHLDLAIGQFHIEARGEGRST